MGKWYDSRLIRDSIIGYKPLYINREREKQLYRVFVDDNTDEEKAKIIYYFFKQWLENGYIKLTSAQDFENYKIVETKLQKEIKNFEAFKLQQLKRIAKEIGIEITYNRDGTANIETNLFYWRNVSENKLSKILEFELKKRQGDNKNGRE